VKITKKQTKQECDYFSKINYNVVTRLVGWLGFNGTFNTE